jgi:hypothetical protein
MSDKLSRQRAARAQAVRAALMRAHSPAVFNDHYEPKQKGGVNADFGWQEARQQLPASAMGFSNEWLDWQLTRRGYGRYFKYCLNRWWKKRRPRRSRRRRSRRKLIKVVYTLGPLHFTIWTNQRPKKENRT